jgi:hypothetical protein
MVHPEVFVVDPSDGEHAQTGFQLTAGLIRVGRGSASPCLAIGTPAELPPNYKEDALPACPIAGATYGTPVTPEAEQSFGLSPSSSGSMPFRVERNSLIYLPWRC